jgi:hypothetical protein
MLVAPRPVVFLAVHDPGLLWIKLKAAFCEATADGFQHRSSFLLAPAVEDGVVRITLEADARIVPIHLPIECIVQEQIVQVFGRRHYERPHLLRRPASKKRQGTKSREGWTPVRGGKRYGDLIVAPVMVVGAKLVQGDLDRVRSEAWKRATGISVAPAERINGRSAR